MQYPPSALVIVAWSLTVTYHDARYRRIPNVLSLGAWVVGLVLFGATGASLTGGAPASCAKAVGFALLVTLPAYVVRQLGAGDVKYLVAIALLTSWNITLNCFVVAALAGGAVAMTLLMVPRAVMALPYAACRLLTPKQLAWAHKPIKERRLAYGPLLTLGLLAALFLERPW